MDLRIFEHRGAKVRVKANIRANVEKDERPLLHFEECEQCRCGFGLIGSEAFTPQKSLHHGRERIDDVECRSVAAFRKGNAIRHD